MSVFRPQGDENREAGSDNTRVRQILEHGSAIVKAVWLSVIVLSITAFSIALPTRYFQLLQYRFATHSDAEILRIVDSEGVRQALQELGMAVDLYALFTVLSEAAFAITFCAVALVARRRQQSARWGMYLSATLVVFGTAAPPTINALTELHPFWGTIDRTLNTTGWTLFGLFYYLFPDGRSIPSYTRLLGPAWVIWQGSWLVFPNSQISPLTWPQSLALPVWLGWFVTGVLAQVYRYLRVSTPVERQQTKLVVFGGSLSFFLAVIVHVPGALYPTLTDPGHPGPWYELVRAPLSALAIMIAPVSLGLAIVRYRLWDIDLVINRTLVYVPLTALLAGLYSASVGLSQRVFIALTGERSDAVIVFTTLVLATVFASARGRLQALVDRRFREMPDPTRELRSIGRQVSSVVQVIDRRALASRLLREAVTSLEASSGAVYLWQAGGWVLVDSVGDWAEDRAATSVPVQVDGTPYGMLLLGERRAGLEYGDRERAALRDTAEVVAMALRATSVAA